MMDRIIFGEGKNDILLIEEVSKNQNSSWKVCKFIGEDVIGNNRGKESRAIGNFTGNYNPYHLLIKSEGNKTQLKRMFSTLMTQLYPKRVNFNLLIDLDGGSFRNIVEEINARCENRFTEEIIIPSPQRIISNDLLSAYECNLNLSGETKTSFGAIGFHHSMEIAAGIDKENDSQDEKERKIKDLAQNSRVENAISTVFF